MFSSVKENFSDSFLNNLEECEKQGIASEIQKLALFLATGYEGEQTLRFDFDNYVHGYANYTVLSSQFKDTHTQWGKVDDNKYAVLVTGTVKVKQDLERAILLLKKLSEKGNKASSFTLAEIYAQKSEEILIPTVDLKQASYYLQLAAQQGGKTAKTIISKGEMFGKLDCLNLTESESKASTCADKILSGGFSNRLFKESIPDQPHPVSLVNPLLKENIVKDMHPAALNKRI